MSNANAKHIRLETCSLCFDTIDDNGKEPLIAGCVCKGESAWVHKSCVIKWLQSGGKYKKEGDNTLPICSICQEPQANINIEHLPVLEPCATQ